MNAESKRRDLISIAAPAHDEEAVIERFHARLRAVLDAISEFDFEIVYVDDGSRDETLAALRRIQASDPRAVIVALSRNFGKEAALTAALDHCKGRAVIAIDADLQDPPELIPELLRPWREEGIDVVYAQRRSRAGESFWKKATAKGFYRMMRHIGRTPLPRDVGDYRLMSRRALDAVRRFPERRRFMKGLFTLIGFEQRAVPYDREPRAGGRSKWGWIGLFGLAIEGVTSFTIAPLRVASVLGAATAALAFLAGGAVVWKTLVWGEPVRGYPSVMTAVLFLGGAQLLALGVIGEYLGRVFQETKRRPLYFVATIERAGADGPEILSRWDAPWDDRHGGRSHAEPSSSDPSGDRPGASENDRARSARDTGAAPN